MLLAAYTRTYASRIVSKARRIGGAENLATLTILDPTEIICVPKTQRSRRATYVGRASMVTPCSCCCLSPPKVNACANSETVHSDPTIAGIVKDTYMNVYRLKPTENIKNVDQDTAKLKSDPMKAMRGSGAALCR